MKTTRRWTLGLLLAALAGMAGCEDDSSHDFISIAGVWHGSGPRTAVSMSLDQSGRGVTGSGYIWGHYHHVGGNAEKGAVVLTFSPAPLSIPQGMTTFNGALEGGQMKGTLTSANGMVEPIVLTRTSPPATGGGGDDEESGGGGGDAGNGAWTVTLGGTAMQVSINNDTIKGSVNLGGTDYEVIGTKAGGTMNMTILGTPAGDYHLTGMVTGNTASGTSMVGGLAGPGWTAVRN